MSKDSPYRLYSSKQVFLLSVIVLFFGFMLVSCKQSAVFRENSIIKGSVWQVKDTVKFDVTLQDSLTYFDFNIGIRNTTGYNYSNLFMFVTTRYPDGNYSIDTVECWLATPDGKWLGKGMGKIKDSEFLFRRNVKMPMKGKYGFYLTQAMREQKLEGIASVSLSITQTKN